MKEESLQVFVRGAKRYFERVTGVAAKVQMPYLQTLGADLLDYSAVIGVTGHHKGCVYFTAQEPLLTRVMAALGECGTHETLFFDLVGEIANTISGNAREELGSAFLISVPVLLQGRPRHMPLPEQAFVIPILWEQFRSSLVISLQEA
jgi:chemotaxis protein CheX